MSGGCAGDGCICDRAGRGDAVLRSFTVEGDGSVRYGRLTPYIGDEPTALAYTPDDWCADDAQVETVALAVESARRWAARTDLSADVRLRRMWTVLTTALEA